MLYFKTILFLMAIFSSLYVDAMDISFSSISNSSYNPTEVKKEIVDKYSSYYIDESSYESEDEIANAFRGMSVASTDTTLERSSSEIAERSSSGLLNELEFASRRKLKIPVCRKFDKKHNISLSVATGMDKYCDKRSRIDMITSDDKSSSCGDLSDFNKKHNDGSFYFSKLSHK
jgi:hypothetical protein